MLWDACQLTELTGLSEGFWWFEFKEKAKSLELTAAASWIKREVNPWWAIANVINAASEEIGKQENANKPNNAFKEKRTLTIMNRRENHIVHKGRVLKAPSQQLCSSICDIIVIKFPTNDSDPSPTSQQENNDKEPRRSWERKTRRRRLGRGSRRRRVSRRNITTLDDFCDLLIQLMHFHSNSKTKNFPPTKQNKTEQQRQNEKRRNLKPINCSERVSFKLLLLFDAALLVLLLWWFVSLNCLVFHSLFVLDYRLFVGSLVSDSRSVCSFLALGFVFLAKILGCFELPCSSAQSHFVLLLFAFSPAIKENDGGVSVVICFLYLPLGLHSCSSFCLSSVLSHLFFWSFLLFLESLLPIPSPLFLPTCSFFSVSLVSSFLILLPVSSLFLASLFLLLSFPRPADRGEKRAFGNVLDSKTVEQKERSEMGRKLTFEKNEASVEGWWRSEKGELCYAGSEKWSRRYNATQQAGQRKQKHQQGSERSFSYCRLTLLITSFNSLLTSLNRGLKSRWDRLESMLQSGPTAREVPSLTTRDESRRNPTHLLFR